MVEDQFNFIYSLLESAKYLRMVKEADFGVKFELSLIIVLIDFNSIVFEMNNGKIATMWFDGEHCPFDYNLRNKILKLMRE